VVGSLLGAGGDDVLGSNYYAFRVHREEGYNYSVRQLAESALHGGVFRLPNLHQISNNWVFQFSRTSLRVLANNFNSFNDF
jgi:hypothetical protein